MLFIQAPYIIYVEVISTESLATCQVPKKIVKNLRQVRFSQFGVIYILHLCVYMHNIILFSSQQTRCLNCFSNWIHLFSSIFSQIRLLKYFKYTLHIFVLKSR